MLTSRVPIVALVFALVGFASPPAAASFIATISQVGSSVVITGSGTINLLALGTSFGAGSTSIAGIDPSVSVLGVGPTRASILDYHAVISGPANFGVGGLHNGVGTGDFFALEGNLDTILLPSTYVSNALLSDTNTFANATFATLGLTPGTYTYTLGSGDVTDTITIQFGPAATTGVPEPAELALLGIGALAGALALSRRRREP